MRGARRAILEHLKEYKTITSREAFAKYGVTRLAAIIFDLRYMGYLIDTLMIDGKTRYGEPCQYAKYVYEGVRNEIH